MPISEVLKNCTSDGYIDEIDEFDESGEVALTPIGNVIQAFVIGPCFAPTLLCTEKRDRDKAGSERNPVAPFSLGEKRMAIISKGFTGRRGVADVKLPPGQYLTTSFPVLSAGPVPHVPLDQWEFKIDDGNDVVRQWDWKSFRDLPAETFTVDLHCVTAWSKLGTTWEGVSLDTILAEIKTDASYALARSYGGYTTNLPLQDLKNKQAWIAFRYDGQDLAPEHGGPARLLVPHLYLWKSAKWVRGITLMHQDKPGFWEGFGYHNYGDPWREQRYQGD